MPRIEYVGPFIDGVVIPYGHGEIAAPRGVPVEVPDDLAASLLEQPSNFQPAKPDKHKAADGHEEGVNDE